jgi:hypothetical protein
MSGLHPTRHAILRLSQRAIRFDDVKLIESIGTEVEGGYLVRRKDVQAFEHELKKLADQARRLEGKRVVVEDDAVVTAYQARKRKERRLLRNAEDRSLSV